MRHATHFAAVMGTIAVLGCNSDSLPTGTAPLTSAGAGGSSTGAAGGGGGSKAAGAGGSGGASAPSTSPAAEAADYAKAENWLCRPDQADDACHTANLDATVIAGDGTLTPESWTAATDAPIDCFYVYPTISNDTTANSDLVAGPEERGVVTSQFARFGSQCRLFAPMYRQVTLTSLRASIAGMTSTADRTLGYNDVLAAWKYYLEHDNQGRGVVLIGHSQGSGVLVQLIKDQLDKSPIDERMISALLIGTTVSVPKDADKGGTFANVPLCQADDQTACVISYASFRSDSPPPDDSLFTHATDPNLVGGCTNPASIAGGKADLHAYMATAGNGLSSATPKPWTNPETKIETPFVSVPGLLSAECVMAERGAYLSITVNGDPNDARVDDISGDVITDGEVQKNWGLHLVDMNVAMGNLLDQVKAKSAAYIAAHGKPTGGTKDK